MKKKHYISLFIVLAALAIIFVPMLLEKPNHLLREEMAMPLMSVVAQAENRVLAKSFAQPRTFRQVPVNISTAASHRQLGQTVNRPEAWVIRVAQFSDDAGVKDLVSFLEKNKIKTFTRAQENHSTLVYAGPEIKKQAAIRLQEKVNHLLTMNTELQAYEPLTEK